MEDPVAWRLQSFCGPYGYSQLGLHKALITVYFWLSSYYLILEHGSAG